MGERFGRGAREDGDVSVERKAPDHRKQSLYFPETMLQELKEEAVRLDRSLSWVVQRAWKIARAEMHALPALSDISDDNGAPDQD